MNFNAKKFFAIAVAILISVFATLIFIYVQGRDHYSRNAKYTIVLGAKLHGDRPSNSLRLRMDRAVEIMNENKNMIMIATGGQGSDESVSEAYAIKKYCVEKGISEDRIILEDKSTNTYLNLKNARKLIKEKGDVKINIVTNRYHIFRAKMLAERNGFKPYGVPAKTPARSLVKSYLREIPAIVKSYIFDR